MGDWTHYLPQSLTSHGPLPLYTSQDVLTIQILYKTFPVSPPQQAEVTPYCVFCRFCNPTWRPLSTRWKGRASTTSANYLCSPSFLPKYLAHNNTQQILDKWINASFSWQWILGIKDTLKRKVRTQGVLPHRGACAVGQPAVSSKEHIMCWPRGPSCECQPRRGEGTEPWSAPPQPSAAQGGGEGARRGRKQRGTADHLLPCPVMVPRAWARPILQKGTQREGFKSWLPFLLPLSWVLRLSPPFLNLLQKRILEAASQSMHAFLCSPPKSLEMIKKVYFIK